MIKLVVLMDARNVIGNAAAENGDVWSAEIPTQVKPTLSHLYAAADAIAVGRRSLSPLLPDNAKGFVLSRTPGDTAPDSHKKLRPCHDPSELVQKHESSSKELVIAGGASLFRYFLPHAAVIEILQVSDPLSGDLVFNEWDGDEFDLVDVLPREGFEIRRFFRK